MFHVSNSGFEFRILPREDLGTRLLGAHFSHHWLFLVIYGTRWWLGQDFVSNPSQTKDCAKRHSAEQNLGKRWVTSRGKLWSRNVRSESNISESFFFQLCTFLHSLGPPRPDPPAQNLSKRNFLEVALASQLCWRQCQNFCILKDAHVITVQRNIPQNSQ